MRIVFSLSSWRQLNYNVKFGRAILKWSYVLISIILTRKCIKKVSIRLKEKNNDELRMGDTFLLFKKTDDNVSKYSKSLYIY